MRSCTRMRFLRWPRLVPLLLVAGLVAILCFSEIGQMVTMSIFCSKNDYIRREGPRWHADKFWHQPNTFPACTMDACFNFSRCAAMKDFRMYVYGPPYEPISYFASFTRSTSLPSQWLTTDASEACVFLVMEPARFSLLPFRPHPRSLPHWNGGLNHVIVSLADKWSEMVPPAHTLGNASVMASCLQQTEYRPEFDISIPLPGRKHLAHLQKLRPWERKYFLTFKGTRYLGHKEGNFRSDPAFRGMHNGQDIIVAVTCRHSTNDKIRRAHPAEGKGCDEDEFTYTQYDFQDMMNATFGLAPAGRSPASYRLIEILSAGAIPVLIADNYVKPFESMIQWHRCLLQFPTTEMHRIVPALRAMSAEEMERRQSYCIFVYEAFLKDDATLVKSVVDALQLRMYGVLPQFKRELIANYLPTASDVHS
ncbi:hypothetical protein L7F22_058681 [Adiantum nelumboides]|nr:hypothetical protein [Adiantum nelumboides]